MTDWFVELYRDTIDMLDININHCFLFRAHLRPALGARFDFTTRGYFVTELSLLFCTLRLELWSWEVA